MLYQSSSYPSPTYAQQPLYVSAATQRSTYAPSTYAQKSLLIHSAGSGGGHSLPTTCAGAPTTLRLLPAWPHTHSTGTLQYPIAGHQRASLPALGGVPCGSAPSPGAVQLLPTSLRLAPVAPNGNGRQASTLSSGRRAPRGIEQLIEPGAILLFGEVHGTAEIPAVISQILSYAVAQGHAVCLGLELWEPPEQQGFLNNYVSSAGNAADRKALFQLPHWEIQDGRQSEAYFAMIEHARVLRQGGARLEAFGFDAVVNDYRGSTLQSRAMAYNVLEKVAALSKETVFILMAGNGHCCTEACAGREPMGFPIKLQHPRMKAFNVRCASGSQWWGIAPEGPYGEMTAGVHWFGDGARHFDPFIDVSKAAQTPGFDGLIDMGLVTPSFPETIPP